MKVKKINCKSKKKMNRMLTFERYEYSSMQRTVMHPNNTDWLSYIDTQQLVG